MLATILRYLRNWFLVPGGIYTGKFVIEDGVIDLPMIQKNQYFRIVGSVFNDGVYQYKDNLKDEVFVGAVWALAIPDDLLEVVSEIEAWQEKYGESAASPYQSESFAGYSYTKSENSEANKTWQTAFRTRLNAWRKL